MRADFQRLSPHGIYVYIYLNHCLLLMASFLVILAIVICKIMLYLLVGENTTGFIWADGSPFSEFSFRFKEKVALEFIYKTFI